MRQARNSEELKHEAIELMKQLRTVLDQLAPAPEQRNFKRKSRLLTAFGETKPVSHWARDPRCATSISNLFQRLRNGWEPEEAITLPVFKPARPSRRKTQVA